jgi:thiamine pyrophosphate-dependent acetolactate synthase large subunit-like protein
MKLHRALAKGVEDLGTTTVFGLLGDANLFFGDSLVKETEVEYVGVAHEAGAVLAAAGYASSSGRVGVATVTHGPALSNTITALIDAARNSIPLVLIAGDTDLQEEGNLQDIPQEALVAPTGAGFVQVRNADQAIRAMATAFRRARLEHRPIVLNIPRSLQLEDVRYGGLDLEPPEPSAAIPGADALDRAAGLLSWAKRPLLIGGRGAIEPEPRAALIELATFLGAPLATTLKAKGLFTGEPLDIGVFGTVSTSTAFELINDADCIVSFGASLSPFTTDRGALFEGKRVIQCNLDEAALGATLEVDEQLQGDSAAIARALLSLLIEAGIGPSGWYHGADRPQVLGPTPAHTDGRQPGTVDLEEAVLWIEEHAPMQRSLIIDGGRFVYPVFRWVTAPDARAYVHTLGSGSIGLAVANAIGAWKGRPDRPAVTIVGDGGFMLGGLAEFNTAVRAGVDMILFVLNDRAYGAEHVQFTRLGLDPAVVEMNWPDFAEVADALGGRGLTVRRPADFEAVGQAIESRDRPLLVDVQLDPNAVQTDVH